MYVSGGALSLLTNGVAGITISTYDTAHRRLLQMMRATAAAAAAVRGSGSSGIMIENRRAKETKQKQKQSKNNLNLNFARLPLLRRLLLDLLVSCRDFFSDSVARSLVQFEATIGTHTNTSNTSTSNTNTNTNTNKSESESASERGCENEELCRQVLELDLASASVCKSPALIDLLNKCVLPACSLMRTFDNSNHSNSYSSNDSSNSISNTSLQQSETEIETETALSLVPSIGRAWALLGLAQLQLSLPLLPVDPAARAGMREIDIMNSLCSCLEL
jgi:hypothetical protein